MTLLAGLLMFWGCVGEVTGEGTPNAAQQVAVSVLPPSAFVAPGGTRSFTATVTGTANTSVTWSVEQGAAGGSITAQGVYTAPSTAGTYNVVATSDAASVVSAKATVTVTSGTPSANPLCSGLTSDTVQRPQGPLAKPGYLRSVTDPIFGTTITRISGDPGTAIGSTGRNWGMRNRHAYSKYAYWSVRDSLGRSILWLDWTSAGPVWLDGETYEVLAIGVPSWYYNYRDYRWHPVLPDVLVAVGSSTGDIIFWNVRTNVRTTVYQGSVTGSYAMGEGEGNPTIDGRYIAVNHGTSSTSTFFVVDLTTCTPTYSAGCAVKRTADISLASIGISSLDWVSMSPLGTYIVVSRGYQETAVLDWNQATGAVNTTRRAQFASGHFDLSVDALGGEVAVNGEGKMFRLADGSRTTILSTNNSQYHSGAQHLRDTAAPDWVWGSEEGSTTASLYRGEVIALGTNGQFYRLFHHRTNLTTHSNGIECEYSRCPYATPSPDGKRVLFASDWGDALGPVEAYVADLSAVCP